MTLIDTLRTALTPIAAKVLHEFGDELTVYRPVRARQDDATTLTGWSPVAGLIGVRGPLSSLSAEHAIRAWGADVDVVAELRIAGAYTAGVRAEDWAGHGIRITSGPETDTSYIVAAARPDPMADVVVLGLQHSAKEIP